MDLSGAGFQSAGLSLRYTLRGTFPTPAADPGRSTGVDQRLALEPLHQLTLLRPRQYSAASSGLFPLATSILAVTDMATAAAARVGRSKELS